MKRSITSASATTEHRINGQIGQPAACMIENKGVPEKVIGRHMPAVAGGEAGLWPSGAGRRYPGVVARQLAPGAGTGARARMHEQSTASVDKGVGNGWGPPREGAPVRARRWIARVLSSPGIDG
ncbi:MAG: hypothetical protein U1E89_21815 [Burkholderiaceae bacterium]